MSILISVWLVVGIPPCLKVWLNEFFGLLLHFSLSYYSHSVSSTKQSSIYYNVDMGMPCMVVVKSMVDVPGDNVILER